MVKGGYMLKKRQKELLDVLRQDGRWKLGRELARVFCVSDRTIRMDIKAINHFYQQPLIVSDTRKGYRWEAKGEFVNAFVLDKPIPQTNEERCSFIMKALLLHKAPCSKRSFCEQLFVSDITLENDLRQIKHILHKYPTLLLSKHKHHLTLKGSEHEKRQLYKDLLRKELQDNYLNLDNITTAFVDFDLLQFKGCLENLFHQYQVKVRPMEIPSILIYIGIHITRMLNGNYLTLEHQKKSIKQRTEYQIAAAFFAFVEQKLPITVPEAEVVFLARILQNEQYFDKPLQTDIMAAADEAFIHEIVSALYDRYDIDFRSDEVLVIVLHSHIQHLLERYPNQVFHDNIFMDEIKGKYPMLFELAVSVSQLIQQRLQIEIDIHDISFIAQHLGGAFERLEDTVKFRVVLINPNNEELCRLCIEKLAKMFSNSLHIVSCLPYYEANRVRAVKPDLLITTIPLEHNLKLMSVKISMFVNEEDEQKIARSITLLRKQAVRNNYETELREMVEERFFMRDITAPTPKDVIHIMCKQMLQQGIIGEDFEKMVLERERIAPTSFVYAFATPHPIEAVGKASKIAVGMLKKPIPWGKYQVKMVLLLVIKEGDQPLMKQFFQWLNSITSDVNYLNKVMDATTYEAFISLIHLL